MPTLFVTATGTEIGKTFVTANLAAELRRQGREVSVIKPVVSGFDPAALAGSDPALLLQAIGEAPSLAAIEAISPWRYAAPLSPDMAARIEGRAIDFAVLIAFCRKAMEMARDGLLIEGIGGLMVPFGSGVTVLDLIEALRVPPLLVAGTYVGSLSHTLSALAALRGRGMMARAIILNETPGSAASPEATLESLAPFCGSIEILILKRAPAAENAQIFRRLVALLYSK